MQWTLGLVLIVGCAGNDSPQGSQTTAAAATANTPPATTNASPAAAGSGAAMQRPSVATGSDTSSRPMSAGQGGAAQLAGAATVAGNNAVGGMNASANNGPAMAGAGGTTAATGHAGANAAAGGASVANGPTSDPVLRMPKGQCPTLAASQGTMLKFATGDAQVWAGPAGKKGPLLLYWYATGSSSSEATAGAATAISDVPKNGGVVAAFVQTNGMGKNTGNAVWYTGDFEQADEVVACANQEGLLDPKFIATAGYSAGGLQCGAMAEERSSYLASAYCMSGGLVASGLFSFQDPSHTPSVIAAHGAAGQDVIIVDFSQCSAALCGDITSKGGLCINCDDGSDHIGGAVTRMQTMSSVGWQFIKEHPFGSKAAGTSLPSYFPNYCKTQ
jgi:hypothetical protein